MIKKRAEAVICTVAVSAALIFTGCGQIINQPSDTGNTQRDNMFSEDDTENWPETYDEQDTYMHIDVITPDDENYYELTDYSGEKTVRIKAPEGYRINTESDSTMMFFDKNGNTKDNYLTAVFELASLSVDNIKEDTENYMQSLYKFYGTDDLYKEMELIDTKTINAGQYEVNYSGLKFEHDNDGYFTKYYYWTYMDDYILIMSLTDCSKTRFNDVDAVQIAEDFFAGIKE